MAQSVMTCLQKMEDMMCILWLYSHAVMGTLNLEPGQVPAEIQETGVSKYQHATEVNDMLY